MTRPISLSLLGLLVIAGINLWLVAVVTTDLVSDHRVTVDKVEWKSNLAVSVERVKNKSIIRTRAKS